MANTGIRVDDEVLEKFDQAIFRKKADGEIPSSASRSDIIQQLMEDFIEENAPEGNLKTTVAIAN